MNLDFRSEARRTRRMSSTAHDGRTGVMSYTFKLGRVMVALFILAIWISASASGMLPGPVEVITYVMSMDPKEVCPQVLRTLYNSVTGFSLSFLISMVLGLLSHKYSFVRGFSEALSEIFNSTSALVWSLVLVATLGVLSPLPPILVVAAVTLPHVLTATISALSSADPSLLEAVRSIGGKPSDEFFEVVLPSSVPLLASASRVGLGTALRISVVAEAFGSSGGVGYMIIRSYNLADASGVLAWSTILVLLVLGLDQLILKPMERRARRWLE
ncbi:MAG TPA: ABC transporter permease subunit [Candidatus Korarchaeota archaeon]|nr:ABC transporter permease subunit [Candidatus Korarchaeota archaeon]